MQNPYLAWLAAESGSVWWNDSADAKELEFAIAHGAQGVTTNPVLVATTLAATPDYWAPYIKDAKDSADRLKAVTVHTAAKFLDCWKKTNGAQGYVCCQVAPSKAGDREAMLAQAKMYASWAPNIAVKMPATSAGLDVLEECAALGITTVATVSYTVPQAIAAAEHYQRAVAKVGIDKVGKCFAVVMVGRLDDYLRDVIHDSKISVPESDIIQAGTAVIKRAYRYFQERKLDAVLMPAGMRGAYHATALAGAKMSMSIHPKIQKKLETEAPAMVKHIDEEVAASTIDSLMRVPDFVKAYEFDGMREDEFIGYGVCQKTLAQFVENFARI